MRFCEEQAIQANAQKRADSEQRTPNTTAASGRKREYEILRGTSDSSEGEEARRFRTEGKMITAKTRSVPTELSEGEQTTMFQAAFER